MPASSPSSPSETPRTTWPGYGLVLLGVPVYLAAPEGRVKIAGERAWLLEWGGEEYDANAKARAAAAALRAANPPGLLDAVPAARTCLVLGGPDF